MTTKYCQFKGVVYGASTKRAAIIVDSMFLHGESLSIINFTNIKKISFQSEKSVIVALKNDKIAKEFYQWTHFLKALLAQTKKANFSLSQSI